MPTYDIHNKKTGETKEVFCSHADKEKTLKEEGPDWAYEMCAPALSFRGSVGNIQKAGSGWKDRLEQIKKGADPKECTIGHLSEDPR